MKSSCFHGHVSALVRLCADRLTLWLLCAVWLSACSHPALELARRQAAQGQQEAALGTLVQAARQSPQDRELRQALTAQRDLAVAHLVAQAAAARAGGRRADLDGVLQRLEQAAPSHPRVAWLRTELARSDRHARLLAQGDAAMASQAYDKAEVAYRAVLSEDPSARRAREQLGRIEEMREAQTR